jgi:hypothetical protein
MKTIEELLVTGRLEAVKGLPTLELDPYVPLRYRTYAAPIGARYVLIGDRKRTILEVLVDVSRAVRGVTITSFRELVDWPHLSVTSTEVGLPVLAEPFQDGLAVRLNRDFRIAVRPGGAIAFWDDPSACDEFLFGGARFLVRGGKLSGVRFDLSEEQTIAFCRRVTTGQASS